MKRSRHSETEIFRMLKQVEGGVTVAEICRSNGISQATFYAWRSKYGGMEISMMKRLRELEEENRRLKKMYAEVSMDKIILQEIVEKKL